MRIAFLSTFYPLRGGIAQFGANLLEAAGRNNEVKAYTFSRQYPSFLFPGKTQYVTPEDKAKVIGSEQILDSINPFTYFSTARRIAEWTPDLVVVRYWMSFLAPAVGTVARLLRRRGFKVVAIIDNMIPHEPKFFDKPCAKWFLKQCDGCVVMSDAVLSDMLSLSPGKPYAFRLHPLYDHFGEKMLRDEACLKLGIPSDGKNLLFFGLIRDYKGLDLLIDALSILDDSYRLIIAGECYGSFEKYENQIAASSARDRIKVFNRYIGDDEVPLFFSAADLCVLPYRSATQSGITAVSIHFDLPVVATPVGGLPQSIGGTGVGIITDSVSSDAVAIAVSSYFSSPGAKDSCLESIRRFKEENTWDNFSKALLSFASNELSLPQK